MALDSDLQTRKTNLKEFETLTKSVLNYLPAVLTGHSDKNHYRIYINQQAGTTKYIRPINTNLFEMDSGKFEIKFQLFLDILGRIKVGDRKFSELELKIIDQTIYTIQQSIGSGLDLLVNPTFVKLLNCVYNSVGSGNGTLQVVACIVPLYYQETPNG
ncbi:MAG: hypothetical protein RIC35_00005 [Marinoscillum sp.]